MNDGTIAAFGWAKIFLMLALIGLIVWVLCLVVAYRYVVSEPTGRGRRARQLAIVSARRLAFLVGAVLLINYAVDVSRRLGAHECRRETEANLYVGELCSTPNRFGELLRIYDAQTGELLAERTYADMDPRLVWGSDRVYYGADEEYVRLPPTWWDQLTAKLS